MPVQRSFLRSGEVVRFAPGSGVYEVVATIPDWDIDLDTYFAEHYGILGLIVDVDGTETMRFANGMTFDDDGNLFVAESFSGFEGDVELGAIWRITPDGTIEKWLENTTLGGPDPFGPGRDGPRRRFTPSAGFNRRWRTSGYLQTV